MPLALYRIKDQGMNLGSGRLVHRIVPMAAAPGFNKIHVSAVDGINDKYQGYIHMSI